MVEQFDLAARNLVAALQAAGGQPDDLVSLQVFVTDLAAYRASMRELGERLADRISAAGTRRWRCSGSPSCSTRVPWSSWSVSRSSRERHLCASDARLIATCWRAARRWRGTSWRRSRTGRRTGQGQPRAGRGALRARARARGAASVVARSRRSTCAWSAKAWHGTRPRPRPPSRSRDWAPIQSWRPGRAEVVDVWIPRVAVGRGGRRLRAHRAGRRVRTWPRSRSPPSPTAPGSA